MFMKNRMTHVVCLTGFAFARGSIGQTGCGLGKDRDRRWGGSILKSTPGTFTLQCQSFVKVTWCLTLIDLVSTWTVINRCFKVFSTWSKTAALTKAWWKPFARGWALASRAAPILDSGSVDNLDGQGLCDAAEPAMPRWAQTYSRLHGEIWRRQRRQRKREYLS